MDERETGGGAQHLSASLPKQRRWVRKAADPEAAGDVLELADEVPLDVVDRIDSKNASASFMLGSGSSLRR